jgi:hypothetical protein
MAHDLIPSAQSPRGIFNVSKGLSMLKASSSKTDLRAFMLLAECCGKVFQRWGFQHDPEYRAEDPFLVTTPTGLLFIATTIG